MTTPLEWSAPQQRSKLLALMRSYAYREGQFRLSSGQTSDYYIDSKKVTLHPLGALLVGSLLLDLVPTEAEAIGGLTLGADPIVTAVSLVSALKRPAQTVGAFIVRKEIKKHGSQQWLEGTTLEPGSKVVIVDDVVTTGASGLQAAVRAEEAGCQILKILAIVDRSQGGRDLYTEHGYTFEFLFEVSEFRTGLS